MGSAATLWGLWQLLSVIVDVLLSEITNAAVLREPISGALAALLIGIPVWLSSWRPLEEESRALNETGSQARRSSIRKGYLYLILFLTVVGSMASLGSPMLYSIFNQILGENNPTFWLDTTHMVATLLPIATWLLYHLRVQQRDGKLTQKELEERHASFPVWVILPKKDPYAQALEEAFQRHLPNLPVTYHYLDDGTPPRNFLAAQVAILSAGMANPTLQESSQIAGRIPGKTHRGAPFPNRLDLAGNRAKIHSGAGKRNRPFDPTAG